MTCISRNLGQGCQQGKNRVSSLLRINFFGTWTLKRHYKKIAKHRSNFSNLSCGCEVKCENIFQKLRKQLSKGGYSGEKLLFCWILSKLPPPPPNLDNLYNFFSVVKIQDLKVSLELKILHLLYNFYIYNLKTV